MDEPLKQVENFCVQEETGKSSGVKKSTKMKLECKECHKTFSAARGLKLHVQHHTGQYSYFCGLCRKGFVVSSHYKEHMRGHEGKGYSCDSCGKMLKSGQFLRYHLSEHIQVQL